MTIRQVELVNGRLEKNLLSSKSDKSLLVDCDITEIIFRTDATFSIFTSTATISGQYVFDSNTSISLSQSNSPFGTITNIVISNSFISFSIDINNGCNDDLDGDKDDDYIESEDPITGTVASATCTITSSLDSGSETQTVTQTSSIQDIVYSFTTTCTETLSASADNLPPGVTMTFNNNQATISGAPSGNASGTYDYTIVVTAPNIATSVSGQISVSSENTNSNLESDCSINVTLVSGNFNQTLFLGQTIEPIVFRVDSDCSTLTFDFPYGPLGSNTPGFTGFANGADFFPNGIDIYTTENSGGTLLLTNGQTTFTISGTLSSEPTPGKYPYYINVNNGYSLPPNPQDAAPRQEATTSITVSGEFTVVATSTTSTSTTSTSTTTDTTPPVITLVGSSTINITVGDSFTDPGATATDNVDGDITSLIIAASTVDTSSAGTYSIRYNVSDAAGNAAADVQRTIVVSAAASNSDNIYFENGTCQCPNATVGDTAVIGGVTYTAVNNSTIAGQIANGNVNLCTTLVTNMFNVFDKKSSFNSDISFWDTSNVTSFRQMFRLATSFNQNINSWDTSSATDMMDVFYGTTSFNQNISSWDVSSVTRMDRMFAESGFNKDISGWDTSSVTNMYGLFTNASSFNQDISGWDTSNVTEMRQMFLGATAFNQNLSDWCVSGISAEPELFSSGSSLTTSNKPIWGKEFTVALTTGSNLQTVTGTAAITDIVYTSTPICTGSISASASGLPSGVSIAFANNVATISGSANTTGTFAYALTFTGASTSQTVTGTITINAAVTADTTPPVISLLGSSTINLTVGDTFTDPGVTANDDIDGDVTLSITASGIVDTTTAGTYVITYSVTDTAGNTTTVDRTINVIVVASSIYFENGTCKCPNATAGDTADINGTTYTAVGNSLIAGEISNGNVNLCTTLVTSMQNLFSGEANFNSDIGFWDTSNVTNMDRLFENASSFNQDISGWCVSNITSEPINFSFNSSLTNANKPIWGTCPSD